MNEGKGWPNGDPVLAVFKIGQEQFMDELFSEGHLYLNSIEYYRTCDNAARDPHEGTGYCQQGEGAILQIEVDGRFETVGSMVGQILATDDELKHVNVYCMHAVKRSASSGIIQLDHLGLGNAAVLIFDFNEFVRRVRIAVENAGHRFQHDLVQYVDRDIYSGPLGAFRKFSTFAAQSEWRIAVFPGVGRPLSLRIGNLSDIALKLRCDDRLQLVPKVSESETSG